MGAPMNREPVGWPSDALAQDVIPARDDDDTSFEFEDESAFTHPRRAARILWRMAPILALTAILLAVADQPWLAKLFHRLPPAALVPITVVCDVPWAVIRVDGRGAPTHCGEGVAGSLPMARLRVQGGPHILVATAEGFAPYPIYIIAHPGSSGLYLTQFSLTADGSAQALDAANRFLANGYIQDAILPASLWRDIGLSTPPSGSFVRVREQFEATALDTYEPFYSETTYQRPITPDRGAVGAAVVVVEHVTVFDGCSAAPLVERWRPVLYANHASVTLSMRPGGQHWLAVSPYALNPNADIYTAPNIAATPATPSALFALAARTNLAERLGNLSMLAGAVSVSPLATATAWAPGLALTVINGGRQTPRIAGARPGAVWLYVAGTLIALTAAARDLAPGLTSASSTVNLDDLRVSLAHQSEQTCGGR
jgi:hypothetical protein